MPRTPRRDLFELNEPRLLYSADAAALALAVQPGALEGTTSLDSQAVEQRLIADATLATAATAQGAEIAFVDLASPDADQVLADLRAQQAAGRPIEIVTLAADEDGLARITETLDGRQDVQAVHLLGHGADGVMQLGATRLDAQALLQRAGEIAGWGSALDAEADLLLYGCDVAADADGQRFITDLAALTGADVAASTDATGAMALGGDWVLEARTGLVDARLAVSDQLQRQWANVYTLLAGDSFEQESNNGGGSGSGSATQLKNDTGGTPGWYTDWTNDGVTFQVVSGSGSLGDPTGTLYTQDDRVVFDASRNEDVATRRLWTNLGADGTTTWASLVVQPADVSARVNGGGGDPLNHHVAGITLGDTGGVRLFAGVNNNQITLNQIGGARLATLSGFTPVAGEDILLVLRIDHHAGNDTVTLYVNPTPGRDGPDATLSITTSGIDLGSRYDTVGLLAYSYGNPGRAEFDELRVGTEYADVAPGLTVSTTADLNDSAIVEGNLAHDVAWLMQNRGADGAISLREALIAANNTTGRDNIGFQIETYQLVSPQTLTLSSALPRITDAVHIDGSTQANWILLPPPQSIVLNGNGLTTDGLVLTAGAGGSEIEGLGIQGFTGGGDGTQDTGAGGVLIEGSGNRLIGNNIAGNLHGVVIDGAGAHDNVLQGNTIGTTANGLSAHANLGSGVVLRNGASNNLVGTDSDGVNDASEGNVLSANVQRGVLMTSGAANNVVAGNLIGTNIRGSAALPNTNWGIDLNGAGTGNVIGGASTAARNVISGNVGNGAIAINATNQVAVLGNYIGVGADGLLALGNTGNYGGILVTNGSTGVRIGGEAAGEGNVIANNGGEGVVVLGSGTRVAIQGNRFFANQGMAIDLGDDGPSRNDPVDLDSGPNTLLNYPVLTSVTSDGGVTTVRGTARPGATVEIYLADPGAANPQGMTLLHRFQAPTGVVGLGDASFDVTFASGVTLSSDDAVTATATLAGYTSEFSALARPANQPPALDGSRWTARFDLVEDTAFTVSQDPGAFSDDGTAVLDFASTLADGSPLPAWLVFNATTLSYSGTPPANFSGDVTVRVIASDRQRASTSVDFVLGFAPVNDAPVVDQGVGPQAAEEDMPFDFTVPTDAFADVDGDTLSYTFDRADGSALPAWLSVKADGSGLQGTPAQPDAGSFTVRVTATDAAGLVVSTTFDLTVSPVNDVPVVDQGISPQAAAEETPFDFKVPDDAFADADGDVLSFGFDLADGSALPAWLAVKADGSGLQGTPAQADAGTISVRVTATDAAGATVSTTFDLIVVPVNDAPVVDQGIGAQAAAEDAPFDFTVPADAFADADGDVLAYSFDLADGSALPAWLAVKADGSGLQGTPAQSDVGTLSVRVTATDAAGITVSTHFDLTIAPVNDAPVVDQGIGAQAAAEDAPFDFTVPANAFADADGDTLVYSFRLADGSALPAWLAVKADASGLQGTPAQSDVGTFTVRVTATDATGITVSTTFDLTVSPVNDAPVVDQGIGAQAAAEDAPFDFTVPANAFADPDGDALSYNFHLADGSALPAWLAVKADGSGLQGTPAQSDVGTFTVRVTATDATGITVSTTFDLTVSSINDAPVVDQGIGAQAAAEDAPFDFTVPADAFADADGDALAYAFRLADGSALPSWLAVKADDSGLQGTPAQADVGTISVRITATDAAGATVSTTFELTVAPTNDAPVIDRGIGAQTAAEDALFDFTVPANAFADADGDALAYAFRRADGSALPSWLAVKADGSGLQGTPAQSDVGTFTVRVTATDAAGITVSTLFDLTVTPVNDAPVLDQGIGAQAAAEDAPFDFTVPADAFADADGEALRYSFRLADGSALPAWLAAKADGSGLQGTPAQADVGTISVRVTATDADGATVSTTFDLTVAPTNDAPVLLENVLVISEGSHATPRIVATDPDHARSALTYQVSDLSGGRFESITAPGVALATFSQVDLDAGRIRFVADGGEAAPAYRLNVSDGILSSQPQAATVRFTPVNDAPSLAAIADQVIAEDDNGRALVLRIGDADHAASQLQLSLTSSDERLLPAARQTITGTGAQRVLTLHPTADLSGGPVTLQVSVSDGTAVTTTRFQVTVTPVDDAPTIERNVLRIENGGQAVPQLSATDPDSDRATLVYSVTSVQGGQFELASTPGTAVMSFTQGQVDAGAVVFSGLAGSTPAYQVEVSDGRLNSARSTAQVQLVVPEVIAPVDITPVSGSQDSGPVAGGSTSTGTSSGAGDIGSTAPAGSGGASAGADTAAGPAADDAAVASDGLHDSLDGPDATHAEPISGTPSAVGADATTSRQGTTGAMGERPGANALAFGQPATLQFSLDATSGAFQPFTFSFDALATWDGGDGGMAPDLGGAGDAYRRAEVAVHQQAQEEGFSRLHEQFDQSLLHQDQLNASSAMLSAGFSAGYVLWLVRGGALLASLASALPAWAMVDPLPVLSRARRPGEADDDHDDQVESMFSGREPRPIPGRADVAAGATTVDAPHGRLEPTLTPTESPR